MTIPNKNVKNRSHNQKDLKKQVDSTTHYTFSFYMDKMRWASLWHQVDEVLKNNPESVLEVGKGTGILGALLSHYTIEYQSVDIDAELQPNHVASVTALPFKNNSFDVVVCFQVLEHIPYKLFSSAISELLRIARTKVIISLPDANVLWRYSFYVPRFGVLNLHIPRPRFLPLRHRFDGEHYWEIGKRGFPMSRIVTSIESCGAKIDTSYRVNEKTYHRFFILTKKKNEHFQG